MITATTPQETADRFRFACKEAGFGFSAREGVLTVSRQFTPGDTDAAMTEPKPTHRLIVDVLTGTILDASTDDVFLIEVPVDEDFDFLEQIQITNNWSPEAAVTAAQDLGWKVTPL